MFWGASSDFPCGVRREQLVDWESEWYRSSVSNNMVLGAVIIEWVLFFAILGIGFVQGYRTGRVTRLAIYLTWFLLPLHAGVFLVFGDSLPKEVRHEWSNQFPEGTHVLADIFSGGIAGAMTAGLGVGVRRIRRGEPLFQTDPNNLDAGR